MKPVLKAIFCCSMVLAIQACQSTAPVPSITPNPIPTEVVNLEPVTDQNLIDYESAIEQLKTGKFEKATMALEQLSIKTPEMEYLFTNLGLAYFRQKNYRQAEAAFERAISQNKSDAVAYNHLGILTRMKGEFNNARLNYETAINIDHEYAPAYLNLGILFDIYLQDLKQALSQYEKFQALTDNEDKTVAGWIVDIKRRLKLG